MSWAPEIDRDPSPARWETASETSSGSIIGMSTEYGWIELTRMLNSPTSSARAVVSATRPDFDAQ
ncbi:hypothetical protein BFG51_08955 [Dietzia alimentaria]|nr:hypothetical protein BFG51_08955 [Dietzia alimentaria]